MASLRICHMIPGFFPISKGGAELFALNLCKKLFFKGHKVYLLTRNLKLSRKEEMYGISIRRFVNILPFKIKYYGFGRFIRSKYIRMLVAVFDLFTAIPTLWKLYKEIRFQLLHISFILPFGLVGVIFKKFFKIPIIVTVHGPADFYEVPPLLNPVLRFVLKNADAVVVVGPKLKKDLEARFGNLSLKLICNGVPIEPYKSNKNSVDLHEYGISSKAFLILTAGRLVRRKNLDLLIRAVPKILEKISRCKIIILGSGIERFNLQKIVEELQVASSVFMPGWISENDKVKLFKRANVFIQLSHVEGLSLALLESKAAGVPAIIVGSGSSSVPVAHNETGVLINPPVTVAKIVNNIIYFYEKPDLCRIIRENVKREAKEIYSLETMVKNYISLYQELLKKNR